LNNNKIEDYRLHQRLGYRMWRLTKLMHLNFEKALTECEVSSMQWFVLSGVEIEKRRSPSDLAKHIGISRPAISRLLKTMEMDDLIQRKLIGEDGRTRLLSLTVKGSEKLNSCWEHIQETDKQFLGRLTQEQRDTLREITDTLLVGEDIDMDSTL